MKDKLKLSNHNEYNVCRQFNIFLSKYLNNLFFEYSKKLYNAWKKTKWTWYKNNLHVFS